ncbi:MAG: hypothetical protein STSR0008_04180 [Ignavibacterium sp.]
MSSENNNNIGKGLLIGFITGGVVGAAIALLFAPKSGKELRGDIRLKSNEIIDDAEKYYDTVKEKADNMINEGKKKSEQLITNAKLKANEIIKDAEKILSDAKTKTGSAISSGKETVISESEKLKDAIKTGVDAYKESKKTNS